MTFHVIGLVPNTLYFTKICKFSHFKLFGTV